MFRSLLLSYWTLILIVAVLMNPVRAQAQSGPAIEVEINRLISQLGDPAYAKREAASRQLLALGQVAKPALNQALQQISDPEIQMRCERLLPRIDVNSCWERVSQIIGETPAIRLEFVEMYWTEKELWDAFANEDSGIGQLYTIRVQKLQTGPPRTQRGMVIPLSTSTAAEFDLRAGRLATMLIIGAQCRRQISQETLQVMTGLFLQKWGGQYAKNTPPALRNSYVTWAEEIASLPIEYVGDKKVSLARITLRTEPIKAAEAQYALLTVAKANDKQDDDLIRSFLNNDNVCDTIFRKGVKTQVQLRDIALAVIIYRAGKDPSDFGFKYLKTDPDTLYRASSLGFTNINDRANAFRAWSNQRPIK